MILLIDNYDSFVYNLARYISRIGRERLVVRNDALSIEEIRELQPEAIILSPGPCTPRESGISMQIIKEFYKDIPMLGICLGHQCMGEAFGGKTIRAPKPMHGKTSPVSHNNEGLFMSMPNPMTGARYHSLITDIPENCDLEVTARTKNENEDTVMALKHKDYPLYGLQFHPESILTDYGFDLLRNFVAISDEWHEDNKKKKRRAA